MDNPFRHLSKPQLYAVIGGSVLLGGYYMYHHHSTTGSWNPFSSGSTASSATASTIDPVTGLPTSEDSVTDPVTGLTYLAEAQQYGSVAAAEASVSAYGQSTASGSGIPVNPASPAPEGSINTPVGTSVYTSNSAWSQAATAGLADIGYNETDVATALGDYLTGTPVSSAQASLINVAIAEYGPPPVGNLQVILQPASTPSTTTSGSTGISAAPPPTGTTTVTAPAKTATATAAVPKMPSGITTSGVNSGGFTIRWPAVAGATQYRIRLTYQGAAVYDRTNSSPSAVISGLTPDHTYTVHVSAGNSAGWSSETNGPAVKTTK